MTLEKLSKIYIKEVFVKYRALIKIIFNRDRKFILKFWETFTAE
jgi:hypothetical protein